jgi:hypothetical protein
MIVSFFGFVILASSILAIEKQLLDVENNLYKQIRLSKRRDN